MHGERQRRSSCGSVGSVVVNFLIIQSYLFDADLPFLLGKLLFVELTISVQYFANKCCCLSHFMSHRSC